MNKKTVVKRSLDLVMTFLLLFLMGYQFWGDVAHEWAGTAMFLCFILHHVLNRNWYRTIGKGKYRGFRILQLVINVLLFLAMLGLMVSGILLSRHVFAFVNIKGTISFARVLHMISAYWGFLLMALHIGMHWMMMWRQIRKKITNDKLRSVCKVCGVVFALYGVWVFWKRKLVEYLFLRTQFVFFDFSEAKWKFYMDYLSMVAAGILLIWLIQTAIKRGETRK